MARDPFIGTWTLNPARSEFDPNHRPSEGTMSFELEPDGHYVLRAHGRDQKGTACEERPQRFIPDDQPYPVPDFAGLVTIARRPTPNTIQIDGRREDGSLAGQATYVVSDDGRSLSATTTGFDSQLRQFRQFTVWEKL